MISAHVYTNPTNDSILIPAPTTSRHSRTTEVPVLSLVVEKSVFNPERRQSHRHRTGPRRTTSTFLVLKLVLEEFVLKFERHLPPVHPAAHQQFSIPSSLSSIEFNSPCALVVEEPVCPLLVVFGNMLWLFVPLKPRLILLVEAPAKSS